MSSEILARIRNAVRERRYQFTDHALEEADNDDLTLDDILDVLLNGELDSTYNEREKLPLRILRYRASTGTETGYSDPSARRSVVYL
jgi:hypothetical protein